MNRKRNMNTSLWILAIWQAKPIFEKYVFVLTKYRGPRLLKRPVKAYFSIWTLDKCTKNSHDVSQVTWNQQIDH